jgi:hypothetical protein
MAQVLFVGGDEVCETSYADRFGKYMRQSGITIPTIIDDGLKPLSNLRLLFLEGWRWQRNSGLPWLGNGINGIIESISYVPISK